MCELCWDRRKKWGNGRKSIKYFYDSSFESYPFFLDVTFLKKYTLSIKNYFNLLLQLKLLYFLSQSKFLLGFTLKHWFWLCISISSKNMCLDLLLSNSYIRIREGRDLGMLIEKKNKKCLQSGYAVNSQMEPLFKMVHYSSRLISRPTYNGKI